jgi:hypothetical protein
MLTVNPQQGPHDAVRPRSRDSPRAYACPGDTLEITP